MRVVPPVLALPFSSARRRRRSPAEDGRGHSRLLTWPGGHGPPLVALRPASGVPRRRGPHRPLPRRRRASPSRAGHLPLFSVVEAERDLGLELDEVGGLNCEPVTPVNSAEKDRFASI